MLSACVSDNPIKNIIAAPIYIPGTIIVVSSMFLGMALSESGQTHKKKKPLSDQDKEVYAKYAAGMRDCRGKIRELHDVEPLTDDPTEQSYIVQCGKAEMKVTCRYHVDSINECYLKWLE